MTTGEEDVYIPELESELDLESGDEFEAFPEFEEAEEELEFEATGDEDEDQLVPEYASRFYEISQMEFEYESDLDERVDTLMTEMERDFFFKKLWRKVKRAGKRLLRKGVRLARRAIKRLPIPGKQLITSGIKAVTQLSRGNLRGLLGTLAKAAMGSSFPRGLFGNLAKTALGAAVPGGAALVPVLSALGFEAAEDRQGEREAWESFTSLSREAYDNLARTLNDRADEPEEAARLAHEAFRSALSRLRRPLPPGQSLRGAIQRRQRRVLLSPGESVEISAR